MEDRKKILLVEDDEAISDLLLLVLEQAGYQISCYPDGDSVLKGNYQMPDLFILDNQLPGPDGLFICQFLKSQKKTAQIPVIIQSASPQAEKESKTIGADAFIEKPFNIANLLKVVKELTAG